MVGSILMRPRPSMGVRLDRGGFFHDALKVHV
jgi:hypothetical protein